MLETLIAVKDWLVAHWAELVQAVLAVIGALEVVAKWTETDKDDKVISKAREWANKINTIVIEIISYITKWHGTK